VGEDISESKMTYMKTEVVLFLPGGCPLAVWFFFEVVKFGRIPPVA